MKPIFLRQIFTVGLLIFGVSAPAFSATRVQVPETFQLAKSPNLPSQSQFKKQLFSKTFMNTWKKHKVTKLRSFQLNPQKPYRWRSSSQLEIYGTLEYEEQRAKGIYRIKRPVLITMYQSTKGFQYSQGKIKYTGKVLSESKVSNKVNIKIPNPPQTLTTLSWGALYK